MSQGTDAANNKLKRVKNISRKPFLVSVLVSFAFIGLLYQFSGTLNSDRPPEQASQQTAVIANSGSAIESDGNSPVQDMGPVGTGPLLEIDTAAGKIRVELYPEHAPNAVTTLIRLTESGYYDSDTLMQSKSQLGFAIAKLGQSLETFHFEDEPNQLASRRGSMAVAKSSASPAYLNNLFFGYASHPGLENNYVIIGQIVDGLELVEKSPPGPRITVNYFKLIERNPVTHKSGGFNG